MLVLGHFTYPKLTSKGQNKHPQSYQTDHPISNDDKDRNSNYEAERNDEIWNDFNKIFDGINFIKARSMIFSLL